VPFSIGLFGKPRHDRSPPSRKDAPEYYDQLPSQPAPQGRKTSRSRWLWLRIPLLLAAAAYQYSSSEAKNPDTRTPNGGGSTKKKRGRGGADSVIPVVGPHHPNRIRRKGFSAGHGALRRPLIPGEIDCAVLGSSHKICYI
jgi:hypothetical protein